MTTPANTTRNEAMVSATEMAMAALPGRFSFAVGGATGSSQPDFIDRAALDQIEARREADAGSFPNARRGVHVPARPDFDFDALVAGSQLFLNSGDELFEGSFYSDGHAARNFLDRASQKLPQRHAFPLRFRVPHGGFQAAFGHRVPADARQRSPHLGGALEFAPFDCRPQKIPEDM